MIRTLKNTFYFLHNTDFNCFDFHSHSVKIIKKNLLITQKTDRKNVLLLRCDRLMKSHSSNLQQQKKNGFCLISSRFKTASWKQVKVIKKKLADSV